MTFTNIKTKQATGFTIVELLIVIVVIAILAAITIVAFNGIQNRSKLSSAQSTASMIAKKAEAWNSGQGAYPPYCQFARNETNATGTPTTGIGTTGCTANATPTSGPSEAKLDDPTLVAFVAASITPANGINTVQYVPCGTAPNHTGARIHFWNYTATTPALTTTATTPASITIGAGCP